MAVEIRGGQVNDLIGRRNDIVCISGIEIAVAGHDAEQLAVNALRVGIALHSGPALHRYR